MSLVAMLLLLSLLCILGTVSAVTDTQTCCNELSNLGGFTVQSFSLLGGLVQPQYDYANDHYWSAANAGRNPACITFPTTAQHVSQIVTVLQKYEDVQFAVKGGGHNANVGWSSMDGGVLIAMQNMSSTTFNANAMTADVGAGATWGQVMTALQPYGVAVVSGRLGDVGVGGLTLGGGLSFMSGQYGMVVDNLVNAQVVLANGQIVNANANTNPNLFFALKGGGNQFGIVTTYTFKAYHIGENGNVWGGIRVYDGSNHEALISATRDFNANYNNHPEAAIITTNPIAIDSVLDILVIFFYYNGATPPAGIFDAFNAIPTITDGVKTQPYADILNENAETSIYGLRWLIRGTTLPNLPEPQGSQLLIDHYNNFRSYILANNLLLPGFTFEIGFQPMPARIPSFGPNALGMDSRNGDYMWMEYDISWLTPLADDIAHSIAMNITATVQAMVAAQYGGQKNTNWQPGGAIVGQADQRGGQGLIFMNDAMYDQLPLQSYGNGNYARLKAIQQSVDPTGFFSTRTGGFKYT